MKTHSFLYGPIIQQYMKRFNCLQRIYIYLVKTNVVCLLYTKKKKITRRNKNNK